MGFENLQEKFAEIGRLENQAESMLNGSLSEIVKIIGEAAKL